jgi:SAM-dependent methyltransferase
MNLARRADLPELMDAPEFPLDDYNACLADLERVNRVTMTHRPTLAFLSRMVPKGGSVSVLDVAYGHGDCLRAIAAWAARRRITARLEGIDLNPRSAIAARARGGDITYRTGDVFDFKPDPRPDFVVSSQFTHHLDSAQLVAFIGWMEATATRGWFISDLHRTAYAYWGFRWLCRVAGWHRVVRHDGTVSIARAFRRDDWERLLAIAGVRGRIRAHLPSRLCVERIR